MTGRPQKVNQRLAVTCGKCGARILQAYVDHNHQPECDIASFLNTVKVDGLKRLGIDAHLNELIKTGNVSDLGIRTFTHKFPDGSGGMTAAYAPQWVVDGIEMYHTVQMYDIDLGSFLRTLGLP